MQFRLRHVDDAVYVMGHVIVRHKGIRIVSRVRYVQVARYGRSSLPRLIRGIRTGIRKLLCHLVVTKTSSGISTVNYAIYGRFLRFFTDVSRYSKSELDEGVKEIYTGTKRQYRRVHGQVSFLCVLQFYQDRVHDGEQRLDRRYNGKVIVHELHKRSHQLSEKVHQFYERPDRGVGHQVFRRDQQSVRYFKFY